MCTTGPFLDWKTTKEALPRNHFQGDYLTVFKALTFFNNELTSPTYRMSWMPGQEHVSDRQETVLNYDEYMSNSISLGFHSMLRFSSIGLPYLPTDLTGFKRVLWEWSDCHIFIGKVHKNDFVAVGYDNGVIGDLIAVSTKLTIGTISFLLDRNNRIIKFRWNGLTPVVVSESKV